MRSDEGLIAHNLFQDDQVASTPESRPDQRFEYVDSENVASQEDVPPDGGYGWVCTACVFLINAHTWGVNSVSSRRLLPTCAYADDTGMGCVPRTLPLQLNIPRSHRTTIRPDRRPIYIPSPPSLPHRFTIEPKTRNQTYTSHRVNSRLRFTARGILLNQDLAPVPQSRTMFRIWHGIPVHHSYIHSPEMVLQKTQSRPWYRHIWCRYRRFGV